MSESNTDRLRQFVDVRLAAAEKMPAHEAAWFCDRWANYVEAELQKLSDACRDDRDIPKHLVGLNAMSVAAQAGRLRSAAVGYRKPQEIAA